MTNQQWTLTALLVSNKGETLRPTLFTIFLNDLAFEIKNSILGINIGNDSGILLEIGSISLFADNIVDFLFEIFLIKYM